MKALKNLVYVIFVVAITVFLCEIACRLFGLRPYHDEPINFEYRPGLPGKLDSVLGHVLIPGYFTITKNSAFTYHVNQNIHGRRITGSEFDSTNQIPKLILLGGSFTYGDFLEDSLTHPYLLQRLFKKNGIKLSVENWGVGGYCPAQYYLQSRDIVNDTAIKYVVINYDNTQDEKTICSRSCRKSIAKYSKQQKYQKSVLVPCFDIEKGNLVLKHKSLEYDFLPFQKKLALVEFIDNLYCRFELRKASEINKRVIKEIIDTLQNAGIKVILTSIKGDDETNEVVKEFQAEGYTTLFFGIDTGNDEYNFNPIDGHPNAKANKIFADSIYSKVCSLK